MAQNSMRYAWDKERVLTTLNGIMVNIFKDCSSAMETYGLGKNYVAGANIAAFRKLAAVMKEQGVV
jgi:glutamate dehydrogenase (NADP+)